MTKKSKCKCSKCQEVTCKYHGDRLEDFNDEDNTFIDD